MKQEAIYEVFNSFVTYNSNYIKPKASNVIFPYYYCDERKKIIVSIITVSLFIFS